MDFSVGFDFDGVLGDCRELKSVVAKQLFGVEIPPELASRKLGVQHGLLTDDQYSRMIRHAYTNESLLHLMKPCTGFPEYFFLVKEVCSETRIVTSRGGKETDLARLFLESYGVNDAVTSVGPGKSKAKACQGLDVFIDDDGYKLESLVGIVPHLFLRSWGYNRESEAPEPIVRVGSLEEFYHAVLRLKENV